MRYHPRKIKTANKPTFIDLVLETTGQHFISLVQAENLDMVRPECSAVDHVEHSPRSTDHNVNALLELGHVLTNIGATNTSMTFNTHIVAKRNDDLLDLLSQLTSGSKNEGLGPFDRHVQLVLLSADKLLPMHCNTDLLKDGNREGSSFASARLCLCDHIMSFDDRYNRTLLDSRRSFETG